MIPITKILIGKEERETVAGVLQSGWVMQGPVVKEFESELSCYTGSKYACAVSSGTAALHLALLAAGIERGDEVITVDYTHVSTINAIRHCGAKPVFAALDQRTYNMDAASIGKAITERTKAILCVHQTGMPCDLMQILKIANANSLKLVEDAACALGSRINRGTAWERIGKPHGDMACFSFHPRKLITTGEGGMVTTNDRKYYDIICSLRNHGSSRMPGYNYRMTDIQAAIGLEQIKRLPHVLQRRRKIASLYRKKLSAIGWLDRPHIPNYCRPNWQSYPVRLKPDAPFSQELVMEKLLYNRIQSRSGIRNFYQTKDNETASEVVFLPIYPEMDEATVDYVCNVLRGMR